MATALSIEAPAWAITRANTFHLKHMDEGALVPFEKLSPYDQRRQKGRWLAYTFTLDDPKRAYVYEAAVSRVKQHAQNYDLYSLVDLGAGNGRNTIKTVRMLHERPYPQALGNRVYLIEQSGAALDEAREHFRKNKFELALDGNDQTSIQLLQKDITATGLTDESIDGVTCVNVFHHIPEWNGWMATTTEINRILKPGGLFVIIDTRPLPPAGLKRRIIEGKIKGAVNFEKFLERAQREGVRVSDAEVEGMRDFCNHDAFKAFENALTREQFGETMRRSILAPSLQRVDDLRSAHPFFKLVYPPLNIAWGIKR